MRILICLLIACAALSAQDRRGEDYTAAVRAYAAGENLQAALAPLATWEFSDFNRAIRALIAAHDRQLTEAAAVFQIEMSIAIVSESRSAAANHLEGGEQLVNSLAPGDAERKALSDRWRDYQQFASTWLGVAGSVFLKESEIELARPWIERGVRLNRASAHLRTLAGTLDELKAGTFHPQRLIASNRQTNLIVERQRRLLQARNLFEEAIAIDAAFAPAHIHLGRVQFLAGNLPRARAAVERGLELPTDIRHQYLGALFLGGILQEQHEIAAARQAYQRALSLVPAAQTATAALSHLELIDGRPDRARALVDDFALADGDDEHWWAYSNGGIDTFGLSWLQSRVWR
jgi:tetratricopeptide (TPR) repeat protein